MIIDRLSSPLTADTRCLEAALMAAELAMRQFVAQLQKPRQVVMPIQGIAAGKWTKKFARKPLRKEARRGEKRD